MLLPPHSRREPRAEPCSASPARPYSTHTAFGASHGASTPSRNRDNPRGHKTGPNTPGGRDPWSPKGHSTRTSGMEDGQH